MAFDVVDNEVIQVELQPMVAMDEAMRKAGWSAPQAEQQLTDLLEIVATVGEVGACVGTTPPSATRRHG